jgi:alkylmercury lyase
MTSIEHGNDASLADLLAGRSGWANSSERVTVTYTVIGLTNFGEHPVPSTRLAEVLGRPVGEAEALARQWGWPGTRVALGLISVDPERAKSAPRRQVQIGDRRFGVTGCAFDIFYYAPLVRPSLQVEETCPATGTPIRIVLTPSGVESVHPAGAVVPIPPSQGVPAQTFEAASDIEDVDANLCVQCGALYSSAQAAHGWLAAHRGSRALPISQVWDLSIVRDWRDRMSALLNLDN